MALRRIRVGLMGFGTVGTGVLKVLESNANEIAIRAGASIEVSRVLVRDVSKSRSVACAQGLITENPADIIEDPDIDIVVEVIGNSHPALDHILAAINAGKHVVTANKEAIARYGDRIFEAAERARVNVRFEGSVAGGIPIIKSIADSLAANRIAQVIGIVNGTTNYILTRMRDSGIEFAQALAEAQALGYAESDPTNDIDGIDGAFKVSILSSVAFGRPVRPESVYRRGLGDINTLDIAYARDLGYVLKFIGVARDHDGAVEASVEPTLVPNTHPLAGISGCYNAVMVRGNASGDLMFSGRGAGDLPTASAVVADIIEISEGIVNNRGPHSWRLSTKDPCEFGRDDAVSGFYIRTVVLDRPGVLATIASTFASHGVSLQSVIQKGRQDPVDLVFVTHQGRIGAVSRAISDIEALPCVHRVPAVIRTLDDDDGRGI